MLISSSVLNFKPPLLAHRGASASAPENTLAAFRKAKELGAAWVEFDVMLCASGEVVVFHDERLERTTNGWGLVAEQGYDYLKSLDAGSWFGSQFRGEKISTLKEVLRLLAELGLAANIELKAFPGKEKDLVQAVLKEVVRGYSKKVPAPLFSSFSLATLGVLRAEAAQCQIGLLIDSWFEGWEKAAQSLNCCSLNLNQELLMPGSVATLKLMGLPLLAYTVNDPQRAQALWTMGISAVFSDCPDKLIKNINILTS